MNLSGHHHGHFFTTGIFLLILVNLIPLINYAEANSKKTSYACEGTNLRLDCEYGKVIHLIRAIYGRFSITICNENGNTDWSVNCGVTGVNSTQLTRCNYQRSCTVMASTKTFGDSCPGTVKYLEVQYQCISANSLMSTTKSPVGGNNKSPWLNNHNPILVNADNNKSLLTTTTVATTSQQQVNKVNSGDSYFEADINNLFHQQNDNNQSISTTNIPLLITKTFLTDASPTLQNENNLTEKYEDEKHFDTIDDKVKVNEDGSTETWDWVSQFNERNRNRETDTSAGIHKTIWSTSNVASDNDNNNNADKNEMDIDTSLSSLPTISSSPSLNSNAVHNNHYDEEHENNSHDLDIQDRENCEAKLDRGMFWNWTLVGETAKQPCPGGASGLARWKCIEDPENDYIPSWSPDSPDLSDCKSAWLLSLQARVLEGDRISNVASDLAQVTSTKQMYGGDIAAAVKIIKTIATRMNDQLRSLTNQISREDLASELLELILEAGSNLLEKARLEPWRDLSYADQMKIATELLVGLEDNAFLLANVINSEKVARKSSKNILATIYSIEANNIREINFPSESKNDHWGKMGDILTMPTEALRENSDGGIVRLVCFAYNNLEHVLQPTGSTSNFGEVSQVRKLVNSRVISASLNQGRHIQLALPVQLTLRHLWVDNVSNPQCVFWDYTQDKWSEEGCRIVKTNRTHTICQCTHLTNFAVIMDLKPPVNIPPSQILQIVVYVGSAVVILCLIFTLIITQFFITGKVFQTMISKNLFICMLIVELVYAFGLHQTSRPMLCSTLTFVMHYFALATILWLFLHGFHLYLIVMEAAENGISRQIWYYGVSYGSPAIVVLLSFLLDPRSYRSEKFCWIQTSFALLCFVGPAAIVACGTAAVLFYTSYKICLLLTVMPKPKPNEDMSLYSYVGSWVRGCLLVLILLTITWTLRLLELESSSSTISYSASVALAIQGIFILIFHIFKSDDMIGKMCDCGTSSDSSDTEMSIHSQQQLQGTLHSQQVTGGPLESSSCHNNAMAQRTIDSSHRNTPDFRIPENIYAKHNIQPSPGGLSTGHRYGGDLGLYSKGGVGLVDGIWTRGNSYSDISRAGYLRSDPVYEEIEKSMSPRASASDISEDDLYSPHHHDIDIYNRRLYGQHQARNLAHYHHHHQHNPHHSNKSRKVDLINVGDEINPLLRIQQQQLLQQQQMQQQQQSQHHYSTNRHRPVGTSDHHHLKGIHPNPDEQILQNVHMV